MMCGMRGHRLSLYLSNDSTKTTSMQNIKVFYLPGRLCEIDGWTEDG